MGRTDQHASGHALLVGLALPVFAPDPLWALAALGGLILWLVMSGRREVTRDETGGTIVPLDVAARALARFTGRPVVVRMPPGTPVLIAPGASVADPWELEVALARSGVRLRLRGARLELAAAGPAHDLTRRIPGAASSAESPRA